MDTIKVWDVVNSIWWSMPMTVESVIVWCTWFDEEGNLKKDTFGMDSLELNTVTKSIEE